MKINDYKVGDDVEVLIDNPRDENKYLWRSGKVISKRYIHQDHDAPYPILIVHTTRTYCKAIPKYRWIDNIPIFVDNHIEFYDQANDEGFLYEYQIRPKEL